MKRLFEGKITFDRARRSTVEQPFRWGRDQERYSTNTSRDRKESSRRRDLELITLYHLKISVLREKVSVPRGTTAATVSRAPRSVFRVLRGRQGFHTCHSPMVRAIRRSLCLMSASCRTLPMQERDCTLTPCTCSNRMVSTCRRLVIIRAATDRC